jgi:DNA-binding transcriptional regulator YiaG
MTEHIPAPLTVKRVVTKTEELRRKREGAWDPTTMVGETSPEGAALRASRRASPEKVADAQPVAIEPLKNETLPRFKAVRNLTTEKPRETDATGLVEIGGRRFVTAGRLASLLGVTVRTLSRWDAASNGPPRIKLGKKVLFDLVKVSDWMAGREA